MLWVLERTVSLMALFSPQISCFNWWKRYQFYVHFCCCLSWPKSISVLQCKLIICNVILCLNCKGGLLLFLLLFVTPIVGFCNCSMFCCALLCVHSSFAIISGCFALFVLLVSHCCVAFPHDAIGLSAVCDCGISCPYSLPTFGETANWLPISYCLEPVY